MFSCADTAFFLAYSTMLLQTALHNPRVKVSAIDISYYLFLHLVPIAAHSATLEKLLKRNAGDFCCINDALLQKPMTLEQWIDSNKGCDPPPAPDGKDLPRVFLKVCRRRVNLLLVLECTYVYVSTCLCTLRMLYAW